MPAPRWRAARSSATPWPLLPTRRSCRSPTDGWARPRRCWAARSRREPDMPGLFDSLSMATASLDAQSRGIDVTGQNLANVNTNGYSRRTLLLAEAPPEGPGGVGGGVLVQGVQALRDAYVQAQLDTATQSGSYQGALVNQLSTLSSALGMPGSSLDAALSSFFNAFSQLAGDPTSLV